MSTQQEEISERYAIYSGDCVKVMQGLPKETFHLSIYSPPFGGLYIYSSDERDLSNSLDYDQFFGHYEFVANELFRLTMPGRMTGVHCMDIPSGNCGTDHLIDFPGDIIKMHVQCRNNKCKATQRERDRGKCGHGWFNYIARYHVWKEPLAVRNRTMAKNLAHKTIVEDSSRCSVASADYLLMFRRKGVNPVPIKHPTGLEYYAGSRKMPAELLRYKGWTGNQIENRFSHWIWRQYASAFWDDIRINRVLPFEAARDSDDEKHVHPLQLDVIERCLTLWSNPKETILTPFMGVGSEVCGALGNDRNGIGIELKPSYFRQAQKNITKVLAEGLGAENESFVFQDERMDDADPIVVSEQSAGF